jgi:hypothetical protein
MISPEAKECNQAMLQRDLKSRPTAPQLLGMPWLAKTAPVMGPMSQSSSSFGSMTNLSSAQPGLADFNEKRAAKPKRPMGAPPGGGFRPRPVRPGGAPPPARGAVGSGTRCVRSLSACRALCLAPLVRLANDAYAATHALRCACSTLSHTLPTVLWCCLLCPAASNCCPCPGLRRQQGATRWSRSPRPCLAAAVGRARLHGRQVHHQAGRRRHRA